MYNMEVSGLFTVQTIGLVVATIVAAVAYSILTGERPYPGIPVLNLDDEDGSKTSLPSATQWMFRNREVLAKAKQLNVPAFQVRGGAGFKIVLSRKYVEELKNHENLSFGLSFMKDMHGELSGFDSIKAGVTDDDLFVDVVQTKLTQSLGLVTEDVIEETDFSVPLWFKSDSDWHTYELKKALLDIVARVSTRVFAGNDLARNEEYLRISKENTVQSFQAAFKLHTYHPLLRTIAHQFLESSRSLRTQVRDATKLLTPAVEDAKRRFSENQKNKNVGKSSKDALLWALEVQKGRALDDKRIIGIQLGLSLAAIHTTTEMSSRALLWLCEMPELLKSLREEIIRVLMVDGWAKTTLYKMKLLDSFLKEVQRVDPLADTILGRYVKKKTTLSDGTVLPKGALLTVLDDGLHDPDCFPEPEKFMADRFLKLREQPGNENRWQFVTTTADHMGFGHGKHACPGRFFASQEIKVMLAFLLLKYDWRFEPGYTRPANDIFESQRIVPMDIRIQARSRVPEIDLMNPIAA